MSKIDKKLAGMVTDDLSGEIRALNQTIHMLIADIHDLQERVRLLEGENRRMRPLPLPENQDWTKIKPHQPLSPWID